MYNLNTFPDNLRDLITCAIYAAGPDEAQILYKVIDLALSSEEFAKQIIFSKEATSIMVLFSWRQAPKSPVFWKELDRKISLYKLQIEDW
jgi:hypothetical protein